MLVVSRSQFENSTTKKWIFTCRNCWKDSKEPSQLLMWYRDNTICSHTVFGLLLKRYLLRSSRFNTILGIWRVLRSMLQFLWPNVEILFSNQKCESFINKLQLNSQQMAKILSIMMPSTFFFKKTSNTQQHFHIFQQFFKNLIKVILYLTPHKNVNKPYYRKNFTSHLRAF